MNDVEILQELRGELESLKETVRQQERLIDELQDEIRCIDGRISRME